MNAVIDEVKEEVKNEAMKTKKKQFTIFHYTIWRLLAYFIIYSFLGYVIETLYGMLTKGVIESRQSFLYGPFCAIYGLGAMIMIVCLQFFNKSNHQLFFGGFVIGSVIEYLVSLFGEMWLHVKWWDYSDMPFNINGRICIFFSIFWGLLAIYLMSYIHPRIDRFIDWASSKISMNALRCITVLVNVLLLADCVLTIYGLSVFFIRKVHENDLNVANRAVIDKEYERIYTDNEKVARIERFFDDEKMIKTFPNLKMEDLNGAIIYFNEFAPEVQPYFYKLKSNPKNDLVKVLKQEKENIQELKSSITN